MPVLLTTDRLLHSDAHGKLAPQVVQKSASGKCGPF